MYIVNYMIELIAGRFASNVPSNHYRMFTVLTSLASLLDYCKNLLIVHAHCIYMHVNWLLGTLLFNDTHSSLVPRLQDQCLSGAMASEQPGQQEDDFSEPEPRHQACGTVVRGKFILYRGLQESFKKLDLRNLPRVSEIHEFDHSPPAWETRQTTGPTPQAVQGSACTCIGPDLYVFAGYTGSQYTNELHAFNTVAALWRQHCPRNPSEGPMRKAFCGMIAIDATTLVIVAGQGIPSGDIQPGSRFVKNTDFSNGRGWTNELHKYDLNIGE